MKHSNKRVVLQCATFAAIFGLMCLFMDMMEETEEQTTYSITLQDLANANGETDGEAGGVVECDLCVVKRKEKVKFSCKSYIGSTCSTSKYGHTLSCNNAKKCSN